MSRYFVVVCSNSVINEFVLHYTNLHTMIVTNEGPALYRQVTNGKKITITTKTYGMFGIEWEERVEGKVHEMI